jgi:hypothetical protein
MNHYKFWSGALLALSCSLSMAAELPGVGCGPLPGCALPPGSLGTIQWDFALTDLGVETYSNSTYTPTRYAALETGSGFDRLLNSGVVPGRALVEMTMTSVSHSASGGQLGDVTAVGSFGGVRLVDTTRVYPAVVGYGPDYINITNVQVDLVKHAVTADIKSLGFTATGLNLFSYETVALPSPNPPDGFPTESWLLTSPLQLTNEGRTAITKALSLKGTEGVFQNGWGTMKVSVSNVPEVDAVWLTGLGLLGVAAVAKRRRA